MRSFKSEVDCGAEVLGEKAVRIADLGLRIVDLKLDR